MHNGLKFRDASGNVKAVSPTNPLPVTGGGGGSGGGLTDTELRASPVKVEPLGRPATARSVAAGATNASVTLTTGVLRVSIYALGADIRYNLGAAATSTSHFIASGERLDIAVTSGTTVQALRNAGTDGTLLISELA